MTRTSNPSYPNKLTAGEIARVEEVACSFLAKFPSKYLTDAEIEREIKDRLHEKATPERAQQAIDLAIDIYHREVKRYESEGGRKRNPPMLVLGNPPREPFPYSSPHGIGSWAPPLPLKKPEIVTLKPRFEPDSPSWQAHRARVAPSLAAYLMPALKDLGLSAVYNPANETVYIHRGWVSGSGMGQFNTSEEEIVWAFQKANERLQVERKHFPKDIQHAAWKYAREPVRVNRGKKMRRLNPKVAPPYTRSRLGPPTPRMPKDDDPEGDIEIAKREGWLPVWTPDDPDDPREAEPIVRKLDDAGQYYDIDGDGNVWVYVGPSKASMGGDRAWKKKLNDVYHALGQPIRFPEVEPGGGQARGRMMNPWAFSYMMPSGDMYRRSYKDRSVADIDLKIAAGRGASVGDVRYASTKEAEEEARRYAKQGRGYRSRDPIQRPLYGERGRNPLSGYERGFMRGHVAAHQEDIGRFSNPRGGPGSQDDADELELFLTNDEGLYHRQFIPIVKNLLKKMKRGVYNHVLSVKLWMYLVDNAAREYKAQFGTSDWSFNRATKLMVAESLAQSFERDVAEHQYDHLLVEPKRPGTKVHAAGFPLEQFYTDLGMTEKEYRYKMVPRSGSFEPLYAKSTIQVAEIMREYPNELFHVFDLKEPRKENRRMRRG